MNALEFQKLFSEEKKRIAGKTEDEIVRDEQYWMTIRLAYLTEEGFINMNNGGVNPQPLPVREAFIRNYEMCNKGPTYYMWKVLDAGREPLRERLAKFIGADKEEVCINRNTTEALDTVIFGLKLSPGDQVILSRYDYPNMINAWKQREMRDGIKLQWIDLQLPEKDNDAIVKKYTNAFTEKTRVILLPHIINWTGQLLPVKQICQAARAKGIVTILDAAHTVGNLDLDVKDLDCDFLGSSLHKWLGAPFGSGLLYCRKELIKDIYPLFPNDDPESADIRKFEWLGTRSFPLEHSIDAALDFHEQIGASIKRKRLLYLRDYWLSKVATLNFEYLTPVSGPDSTNLVTFSTGNKDAIQLEKKLLEKGITVAAFKWEKLNGIRVTPNIYTSLKELDRFAEEITSLMKTENEITH